MSRILLIEDEEAIRRVLKKILLEEDASNDVQEASDGKQAIEVFGDGTWDLVFCDIKMPHMDGVDTAVVFLGGSNANVIYFNADGESEAIAYPGKAVAHGGSTVHSEYSLL